jgi:hypothetical protein
MKRAAIAISAVVLSLAAPSRGLAIVTHRAFTSFVAPGQIDSDNAQRSWPASADIDEDLFASIPTSTSSFGYEARASVGRFGQLGVSGRTNRADILSTYIEIKSDENINLSGRPLPARSQFLIDGGFLQLAYAPDAKLEFELRVESVPVLNGIPLEDLRTQFQTSAVLTIPAGQETPTSFTASGRDIGMTFDGINRVEIPLSLQTFELGEIPSGAKVDLGYFLTVKSTVPQYAEALEWAYSDPLTVDLPGANILAPTIEFYVPEQSTATFFLLGVSLIAARRRRPQVEPDCLRPERPLTEVSQQRHGSPAIWRPCS